MNSLGLTLALGTGSRGRVSYDFTGGSLPSGITFTRASTGTYYDGSLIQTAAINVARFESSCLLYEPQRLNNILRSEAIDNASWTKNATTISANAATAPDGAATADKVIPSAASAGHLCFQSGIGSASVGITYTDSVYVKAAGYGWAIALIEMNGSSYGKYINIATGATGGTFVNAPTSFTVEAFANGWYRLSSTKIATGTNPVYSTLQIASGDGGAIFVGDGTSGVYFWGAQTEIGASATSYIPTAAAQVTRSADVASFTIPPGVATLRYTFDDDSTQDVSVSPGAYTIPTTLNRPRIKRIASV